MGVKLLVLFVLLLLLCLSIYNWWFLKSRHGKQPLVKKKTILDSHVFWGAMSVTILLIILGITTSALYSLIVSVMRMQQGG